MQSRQKCRAFQRGRTLAASAAVVWLGFAGNSAHGQAAKSPFLPPGFGAQSAPPPASTGPLDSVELRAVLTLEGKTFVTLFDTGSSKSFMLEVGETVNNIKVADYKLEGNDDMVTLESGGKTRRVPLKKAKIVAMATPPPTAVPLPPGVPPGGQQPGSIAPAQGGPNMPQMSDEEVRQRMQRVAEEIRRRRAVRREMLENSQPPASP